jgi:hypothetical protein
MTKPPNKKLSQESYVHSALRMPESLRNSLKDAALKNGRSMNAEILARLQTSPTDEILAEIAEMKHMLRKVLDQI